MRKAWPSVSLCVLLAVQALYYLPRLPQRVATHFDWNGNADGHGPPSALLAATLAIAGLACLLSLGLPSALNKLPTKFINLPHRDYWLAAERREQTLRRLADFMRPQGTALLLFMLGLNELVYRFNLSPRETQPQLALFMPVALGALLVFNCVWIVRMLLAFKLPEGEVPSK